MCVNFGVSIELNKVVLKAGGGGGGSEDRGATETREARLCYSRGLPADLAT